jgi:predicted transcriptional regulator
MYDVLHDHLHPHTTLISRPESIPDESIYDLITADLPFGLSRMAECELNHVTIRTHENWLYIAKSLRCLSDGGIGMYFVEPHALRSVQGTTFRDALSKAGFHTNAIINGTENLYAPQTPLRPVLLLVTKSAVEKVFIAELMDSSQARIVAKDFCNKIDTGTLEGGTYVEDAKFKPFAAFKSEKQIEVLSSQYKEYKKYTLAEISTAINAPSKKGFTEQDNALYLPKLGTSPAQCLISEFHIKPHNYFQIVLNKSIVTNAYLKLFLSSALGRLVYKSLLSSTVIPSIRKDSIQTAMVPVPSLTEQNDIVVAHDKLASLRLAIDGYENELALNPKSARTIVSQVDNMLVSLNMLSDAERILKMCREGESKQVEFKQTLSVNMITNQKDKNIELAVLKTIVAFANTEGGTLLTGVSDKSEIVGVDGEIKVFRNEDEYVRHYKSLIKDRIGVEVFPYVDYKLVDVNGKKILFTACQKSPKPCFLNGSEFYIRTNPATEKVEGRKLVDYIKLHFE